MSVRHVKCVEARTVARILDGGLDRGRLAIALAWLLVLALAAAQASAAEPSRVWSWGANGRGQLGDGTEVGSNVPVMLQTLAVRAAAGEEHSLACDASGYVWTWGSNDWGQLGNGTWDSSSTPAYLTSLTSVQAVAAGGYSSAALDSDGYVWTWGDNWIGQLGHGDPDEYWSLVPAPVVGQGGSGYLSTVQAIASGYTHMVALKQDGTVWTWGSNQYGQLGNGSSAGYSLTPVQVTTLANVKAIAAGWDHCVAVKTDGTVWAWGRNDNGQLGNNSITSSNVPVQVSGLSGVDAVGAGAYHSLAVKNDDTVWAWGANGSGQLGDGTTTERHTAVQMALATGAEAVAGGQEHTLIKGANRWVYACGANGSGQLGDGTYDTRTTPVRVQELRKDVTVACGSWHTVLVIEDPIQYTLALTADPASKGTVAVTPNLATYDEGELVTIEAHANPGEFFTGWDGLPSEIVSGTTSSGGSVIQFNIIENLDITANFEGPMVWFSYEATAGGSVSCLNMTPGRYEVTDPPSQPFLMASADSGYGFLKWLINGEPAGTNTTLVFDLVKDSHVVGVFAPRRTVIVSVLPTATGTVTKTPNKVFYVEGETVTLKANPASGYAFSHWTGLPDAPISGLDVGDGSLISFTVCENHRITANFASSTVTLAYGDHTGGDITGDPPGTYPFGATVNLHASPHANYRFVKWTVNGADAGTDDDLALVLNGNKTVAAVFAYQYTLTVAHGSGSGVYDSGAVVEIVADYPPAEFDQWTGDVATVANVLSATTTITMTGNYTVTATRKMASLAYGDHAGGEITGDPEGTYPLNTTVNLHASAHANYRFVRWLVNGGDAGSNPDLELVLDGDKTVAAVFAYQYTLTVVHGSGSGVYDDGAVVEIVADYPPAEFDQWTGDVATVANVLSATTTITMTGDYTVTATAKQTEPLEVTVAMEEGLDWVYQNIPASINNGGHCLWLEVTVVAWGGNESVTVTVAKEAGSGSGEVIVEDDDVDPMVKWIVGPTRVDKTTGVGPLVLRVTATGNVQGEDVVLVPVTVRPLGDIDGNGGAEPTDTSLLINKLNGMDSSGMHRYAFDLDRNGGAEPTDLSMLTNILNGML
ncbi:MAG TPA: dockerin type I domain-containing protein [Phycisphaerae bacterium]|nr:dockerin type I domain-containing protein [Phycisphaerae bacterium]